MKEGTDYIKIPILTDTLFVILTIGDDDKVRRILKLFKYPKGFRLNPMEGHLAMTFYGEKSTGDEKLPPVIALAHEPHTIGDIARLGHEAVHAVEVIWQFLGQKSFDEVGAYAVEAIIREGLKFGGWRNIPNGD